MVAQSTSSKSSASMRSRLSPVSPPGSMQCRKKPCRVLMEVVLDISHLSDKYALMSENLWRHVHAWPVPVTDTADHPHQVQHQEDAETRRVRYIHLPACWCRATPPSRSSRSSSSTPG